MSVIFDRDQQNVYLFHSRIFIKLKRLWPISYHMVSLNNLSVKSTRYIFKSNGIRWLFLTLIQFSNFGLFWGIFLLISCNQEGK